MSTQSNYCMLAVFNYYVCKAFSGISHQIWYQGMVEFGLSQHPIVKLTTLPLFQGRGERAYDIYSRLLRERIICVMGPVSASLDVDMNFAPEPRFQSDFTLLLLLLCLDR